MSTDAAGAPRSRPPRRKLLRRRGRRFWLALGVAGAALAFYAPGLLATQYTSGRSSPDYLVEPWQGWHFLYAATTLAIDADLNTSALAIEAAKKRFNDPVGESGGARVLRVRLVFADGQDVPVTGTSVRTPKTLSWEVVGRLDGRDDVLLALLDYSTGATLWEDGRLNAPHR